MHGVREAALDEPPLGDVARQRERALVGRAGLRRTAQRAEELSAVVAASRGRSWALDWMRS